MGAGYAPSMSVISVNIGASATEIAILHNGDVIYSDTHDIGGEQFDEAVREYILEQGDLSISLLDARAIKEDIGSVWDDGQRSNTVTISGTMALTGNKIVLPVSSEDILGVFEKPLYNLLNAIAQGIKKIPTDYVESIFANGIVLSGGGAMLHGLDKMIEKVFSIGTVLARNPQDCVSSGLSVANSIIPTGLKPNGKNVTSQLAKFYKDKKQK
jgi:rod shape-determining protein MreB